MPSSPLIPVLITYPQGKPTPWTRPDYPGTPFIDLCAHLSGWLTPAHLQAITASEQIRPWLGVVLMTDDGSDVYDAGQVESDLEDVAGILSEQLQRAITAGRPGPADIMATLLSAQDASCHIEPECTASPLAKTDPTLTDKILPGYVVACRQAAK